MDMVTILLLFTQASVMDLGPASEIFQSNAAIFNVL